MSSAFDGADWFELADDDSSFQPRKPKRHMLDDDYERFPLLYLKPGDVIRLPDDGLYGPIGLVRKVHNGIVWFKDVEQDYWFGSLPLNRVAGYAGKV